MTFDNILIFPKTKVFDTLLQKSVDCSNFIYTKYLVSEFHSEKLDLIMNVLGEWFYF